MSQPTTFKIAHNNSYQPSNFNDYYADAPITLAQALPLSDNIYAVKTGLFVGIDQLVDTAQKVGITSDLPEVPRSEEHTSELQSRGHLVCRLLLEIKNKTIIH